MRVSINSTHEAGFFPMVFAILLPIGLYGVVRSRQPVPLAMAIGFLSAPLVSMISGAIEMNRVMFAIPFGVLVAAYGVPRDAARGPGRDPSGCRPVPARHWAAVCRVLFWLLRRIRPKRGAVAGRQRSRGVARADGTGRHQPEARSTSARRSAGCIARGGFTRSPTTGWTCIYRTLYYLETPPADAAGGGNADLPRLVGALSDLEAKRMDGNGDRGVADGSRAFTLLTLPARVTAGRQ